MTQTPAQPMISESDLQRAGIKIRLRHRRGRPPEAYGDHRAWDEWQVVDGRRVAGSYDFHHQARAAAARLLEARRAAAARLLERQKAAL